MKVKGVRIAVMAIFVAAVLCLFVYRLMTYQLVNGASYRKSSEATTMSTAVITAPRGEIVDRYGRSIATNRVGYNIVLQYAYFPNGRKNNNEANRILLNLTKILSEDQKTWADSLPVSKTVPYQFNGNDKNGIAQLQKLLASKDSSNAVQEQKLKEAKSLSAEGVMQKLILSYGISAGYSDEQKRTIAGIRYQMEIKGFSLNNTVTLATDVSMDTVNKISERNQELPGVQTVENPVRVYTTGTLAPQTIGTVGPMSSKEYNNVYKNKGYSMDSIVGKFGIEYSMESYLKGTNGTESIEVNSKGKVVGSPVVTTPSKPGDTIVTTLDGNLQTVLQNSLEKTIKSIAAAGNGNPEKGSRANSGAACVLDVRNGEVLALASYPNFDLNNYFKDFSTISKQDGDPLLNKVVSGAYRPGSTFKPITAIAGLLSGKITATSTFFCSGKLVEWGQTFKDDAAHGSISVIPAIEKSCNVFFYRTGYAAGIKTMNSVALSFGLGKKTGIELPGELDGILAGPQEFAQNGKSWNAGDVLQAAIGQSDNKFTPLQIADYLATIVNGGIRYQPHIIKQINTYDNSRTIMTQTATVTEKVNIPASVLNIVKQGMGQVTENGTASSTFSNYRMKVGGKTGTAEIPGGGYNSVFMAFAPYDNPQIVVVAVVEHGAFGSAVAPIARDVFDAYFYNSNSVQSPQKDNAVIK